MTKPLPLYDSDTAAAYDARQPYLPGFFAEVGKKLFAGHRGRLADLAAGTGDLAVGFSPFFSECLLVDASAEMLKVARRRHYAEGCRVSFLKGKVQELRGSVGTFDAVTIGRALHWLPREDTLEVLEQITRPGSFVITCYAGTFRASENPWHAAYSAVRRRYTTRTRADLRMHPTEYFRGSRFKHLDTLTTTARGSVPLDLLVRRAFSYSTTSRQEVGARAADLEAELREVLEPFAVDGRVPEVIHSTAVVFR